MTPTQTFTQVDQFDLDQEVDLDKTASAAKTASALMERRAALTSAPDSDFALVIWNGTERSRKFPIGTDQDVRDSFSALEKSASALPEELVKTARHFIELGARAVLSESLYEDAIQEDVVSNLVYTGDIDQGAFYEKRASLEKVAGSSFPVDELGTDIYGRADVERVEDTIAGNYANLSPRDLYNASRSLLKAASALGVEVTSPEVTRYAIDATPDLNEVFASRIVEARASSHPEAARLYEKVAAVASKNTPIDVADAMHAIDQLAGFAALEGEKVANTPIGSLFRSAYDEVFDAPQVEVPSEFDFDKVAEFFGDDFAESLKSDQDAALGSLSPLEIRALRSL